MRRSMSKQSGYQQLSSEGPSAQEYGFAARLPQAGASGEYHGPGNASGTGGGQMAGQMAYPGEAYAGVPVTGYPVMTTPVTGPVAGPVGMVVLDPLGKRERKRERKQARRLTKAAGGCRRCQGCRRRRVGPVGLLVGLVRSALPSSQGRRWTQSF